MVTGRVQFFTSDRVTELSNCNFAKAILMICIVLYHSMAFYTGEGWSPFLPAREAPWIGYIAKWLNSFHVYAFTFISGYIFYALKIEKGKYQQYGSFLIGKAKRLLIPYLFMVLLWVGPVFIYFYGTEVVLSKFILGINPSQLWFLLMLFWIFVIYWWIAELVDKKPILGAVIVFVFYLVGGGIGKVMPDYYCFETGLQFMIFFHFGFIIRKYGTTFFNRFPALLLLLVDIALFVVSRILEGNTMILAKLANPCMKLLLHLFGALMAFIILQRVVSKINNDNKFLTFLSCHSMTIYLVHQQLIYFTIKWFNGIVPPVILVIFNFIFAFSLSALFAWLMSKTRVTRFLIGAK